MRARDTCGTGLQSEEPRTDLLAVIPTPILPCWREQTVTADPGNNEEPPEVCSPLPPLQSDCRAGPGVDVSSLGVTRKGWYPAL